MKTRKNIFVVITGPSGAGKTTVTQALLKHIPNSTRLITTTTREKRDGETDGIDYNFVTDKEFLTMKENGDFFEYAEVYGKYYGSQKTKLKELLQKHPVVFSLVDVEGAQTIKTKIPDALTVFIAPDSIKELKTRLLKRDDTDKKDIEKRIKKAEYEMDTAQEFDVIVKNINGELDKTIQKILDCIHNYSSILE